MATIISCCQYVNTCSAYFTARMEENKKASDARRAEYEAARKARFQEISTQGEETKAADDKGA